MHIRAIGTSTCGPQMHTELVASVLIDLSEGEGEPAGAVHQAALHPICFAVRDVVLPAVASWASHNQQGPRRQQHSCTLPFMSELHHGGPCQRQGCNCPCNAQVIQHLMCMVCFACAMHS